MQVLCNKLMDKNSRDFFCSLMEKAHEDSGYSDDEEEGAGEVKKEPATEERQGVCLLVAVEVCVMDFFSVLLLR